MARTRAAAVSTWRAAGMAARWRIRHRGESFRVLSRCVGDTALDSPIYKCNVKMQ